MIQTIVECANCSDKCSCFYNHLNYRLEQLAQKTQEYNELLEQHKELDDRANRLIEEKYNLSRECEELKREIDLYKTWYRAKHDDIRNLLGSYRKALEEIEDICNVADRYELEELQETIFNIINKAKGEE